MQARVRPGFWQEVAWILGKDLRAERRTLGVLTISVLLACGVVAACAVAGSTGGRAESASAAIWVAIAFCGVYTASNSYRQEQATGALEGLLAGPVRPLALYAAKALMTLLVTGVGAVSAVGMAALLIHGRGLSQWPVHLLGIVAGGCLGFSVLGALVAPLLGGGAAREALLALVLLPLGVPLIVSGARATSALYLTPAAPDVYLDSLGIVLGLDGVFLVLSLWLFGPLVRRRG